MDGGRFDSLARALAAGGSRRQVLKGLLGLGGAAVVGSSVLEGDASAAVRPTPTPKPLKCPGKQIPVGGKCTCPNGLSTCGPDCCNPGGTGASHSECCDNACCRGTCYGEEQCCPYPRHYCPVSGQCCPEGWTCCPDFGCISPDQCCTADDCPDRACVSAVCNAQHRCDYVDNCTAGTDCCDAAACYRGNCQGDGTCGAPTPDCRTGTDCCAGGTCLQDSGECCIPGTCAELVAPYSCPSAVDDGCGGTIDCSGACPAGWQCDPFGLQPGVCFNRTKTCEFAYCEEDNLGRCLDGFCYRRLDGSLGCFSTVVSGGFCGYCTSQGGCQSSGTCLIDGIECTDCGGGAGSACGYPA